MPFRVTVKDEATPTPNEAEWVYTTDVRLFVEIAPYGRNAYRQKLISTVIPGERICRNTARPCHSREVISVTEF